jgi:hypothetical protein
VLDTQSPKPSTSDTASSDPVADPNCVGIRTCTNSAGHWQCLLGKPCGFFKGDCGTCPALLVSSRVPSSGSRSTSVSEPSPASSFAGSGFLDISSSGTRTTSTISSGNTPVGGGSSVNSAGNDVPPSFQARAGWKAVVALVPAYIFVAY